MICENEISAPINGFVNCSDEFNIGSICAFSCDAGFSLLGPDSTTCVQVDDAALWDNDVPICQGNAHKVIHFMSILCRVLTSRQKRQQHAMGVTKGKPTHARLVWLGLGHT